MLVTLGLLPTMAEAFSLQLRGGVGEVGGRKTGSYIQGGVDTFIYEGRLLDLFVGAEYADFNAYERLQRIEISETFVEYNFKYSWRIMDIPFGLHLKLPTKGRWKPYLALGGIAGSVYYYKVETNFENVELLSTSEDSRIFLALRVGGGIDIGLGTRFSLGIELNDTIGVPSFNAIVSDLNTGEVTGVIVNDGAHMIVFNLGLRYFF